MGTEEGWWLLLCVALSGAAGTGESGEVAAAAQGWGPGSRPLQDSGRAQGPGPASYLSPAKPTGQEAHGQKVKELTVSGERLRTLQGKGYRGLPSEAAGNHGPTGRERAPAGPGADSLGKGPWVGRGGHCYG